MLNSDDPRSIHVFRASAIQDCIHPILLGWKQSGMLTEEGSRAIEMALAELRALNAMYFNLDPGISRSLDALGDAVRKGEAEFSWELFCVFANSPGENFGTWLI